MGTKNITLAIDEDLLQRARVIAAIRRTSVNDMVREFLIREVDAERQHDEVKAALLRLATDSQADFGPGPFIRGDAYTEAERFDRWS